MDFFFGAWPCGQAVLGEYLDTQRCQHGSGQPHDGWSCKGTPLRPDLSLWQWPEMKFHGEGCSLLLIRVSFQDEELTKFVVF